MTNFVVDLNAIPAIQSKMPTNPSFLSLVCQTNDDCAEGLTTDVHVIKGKEQEECCTPTVSSSKSTNDCCLSCPALEQQIEPLSNAVSLNPDEVGDGLGSSKLLSTSPVERFDRPQLQSSKTKLSSKRKGAETAWPAFRFVIENEDTQLNLYSHKCIPKQDVAKRLDSPPANSSQYSQTSMTTNKIDILDNRILSPKYSYSSITKDSQDLRENQSLCERFRSSSQHDIQGCKDKSWIQSVDSCLNNRRRIHLLDYKTHEQEAAAERIKAFEQRSVWKNNAFHKTVQDNKVKSLAIRLPVNVILNDGTHVLSETPSGISRITYYPYFITKNWTATVLREVNFRVDWSDTKQGLVAWCGESHFAYNGKKLFPDRWPPCLFGIREQIIAKLHLTFNGVLIRLFQNGSQSSTWYHDDGEDLIYPIAVMIFGSPRMFVLRKRIAEAATENQCTALNMPSGSILVVEGYAVRDWESRITESIEDLPCIAATFYNVMPEENKF